MADILVRCPSTGAAISTGLRTEWVVLSSLPRIAIPLRCPVCGQVHKWNPQQAWAGSLGDTHGPPARPDGFGTVTSDGVSSPERRRG
jgi:hypothetical protein